MGRLEEVIHFIMYEDATMEDAKNAIEELQKKAVDLQRRMASLEERISKEYTGRREEQ
jgi:predicted transcriptional regulator